jgi:hypothetical protein
LKAQREDKQNNTIDRTKLAKLQALVDEGDNIILSKSDQND